MTILLAVPWDQKAGGVASVVGNLARSFQNNKHRCIFFHPGQGSFLGKKTTKWGFPGYELRLGAPWRTCPRFLRALVFPLWFPFILGQLIYLIRRDNIQIINIHYPMGCFFYFAVCRWFLPVKLVTSIHGADLFPRRKLKQVYSWMVKFTLLSSDIIVAPSQKFRQDFLRIFPTFVHRSVVIYNSVDTDEFNNLSTTPSHRSGKRYLLCIAAHNMHKGLDTLIRAFSTLQAVEPALTLVLAGDGPLRRELEALATALGVQDRIEFLGWKTRPEIVNLLHNCEAFVLPSRSEAFGIALIEAMTCKKPVISTMAGGIPEIIESGENGILVEPNDPNALAGAIMTVLKDPDLQRTLGMNGYLTVQARFRRENNGAAYEALFNKLLNSGEVSSMHG